MTTPPGPAFSVPRDRQLAKIKRTFVTEFTMQTAVILLLIHTYGVVGGILRWCSFASIATFLVWPILLWWGTRKASKGV